MKLSDRGHIGGVDVLWTIFLVLAIIALLIFIL